MEHVLLQLGLSSKQIQVYSALLDTGPNNPSSLAEICKLPRPTVYAILSELVEKGFVQEDLMATKKLFIPTPPEALNSIIVPLQAEIAKKTQALEELIPLLIARNQEQVTYTPHITYIPHARIEGHLRAQTPKWNASMHATNTEYVGFQDHTATEIFADWIRWYWQQPSTKGLRLRLIANPSEFESNVMSPRLGKQRKVLEWEGAGAITFSTWINGDYTLLINTRQRPFYLIEIYDPGFAQSQRQIFETVWQMAVQSN